LLTIGASKELSKVGIALFVVLGRGNYPSAASALKKTDDVTA
jgi:hypothetical protein